MTSLLHGANPANSFGSMSEIEMFRQSSSEEATHRIRRTDCSQRRTGQFGTVQSDCWNFWPDREADHASLWPHRHAPDKRARAHGRGRKCERNQHPESRDLQSDYRNVCGHRESAFHPPRACRCALVERLRPRFRPKQRDHILYQRCSLAARSTIPRLEPGQPRAR